MQDLQCGSLKYTEALFNKDKYPQECTISHVIDSLIRLNYVSFDVDFKSSYKFYFDQIHFSNLFKIFTENLVYSFYSKGKAKPELFRDNSIHAKFIKRYLSCNSNYFREHVMEYPLEKMIKTFKGFNMEYIMNEEKSEPIRDTIIKSYEHILQEINQIPEYILEILHTIYETVNHYYCEEDDPSSTTRIKKILPIINIMFMRFLFSPDILDLKPHITNEVIMMQVVQWMSKAFNNITFGKIFMEGSEYGLHLINDQVCRL